MHEQALRGSIGFKIMFLGCVIGRRGIPIQLPPSSLAKNIILKPILPLEKILPPDLHSSSEGC